MSSMMQKAIRRGEVKKAAYAAIEMFGKYWNYMWKRLIIISAEDCYGIITKEIVALYEADKITGGNKKGYDRDHIFAAKAIVLLCLARKNRDACYVACNFMNSNYVMTDEEFDAVDGWKEIPNVELDSPIPSWVFDVHTHEGKRQGKTLVDMVKSEQEALNPHQISLFDDGDWNQFFEGRRKNREASDKEWNQYQTFKTDKVTY
jgi:replication-associated recombination protein RarA